MPSLSVIVPVHNGGASFKACIEGLAACRPAPDEVVVVADGETDGSWRHALGYGARVVRHEPARGPAYARNRGAEAATGDLLLFIDADVVVRPDVVGRVKGAFARHPDLDALIGSYDDAPGHPSFLSQYRNLLHHYTHQTSGERAFTFWGACGAVRREAFEAVGGFDEGYRRPSIEDIELGYRLRTAGFAMRLDKEIQVKHLKRWTARSILKTDVFQRALPWTALILEHERMDNDLSLSPSNRLSVVAVGAFAAAAPAAFFAPAFRFALPAAGATFLALNAPFYRFLLRKRGVRFALQAVPWHALYYAYSGGAFALGTLRHLARRLRPNGHSASPTSSLVRA